MAELKKLFEKLWTMKDQFETIYPSHGSLTVDKEIIPKLIAGAKDVMDGKVECKEVELFGNKMPLYQTEAAGFFFS